MKKLLLAGLLVAGFGFAQDIGPKYNGAPVDDSSRSAVKRRTATVKTTHNTVITEMPMPTAKKR